MSCTPQDVTAYDIAALNLIAAQGLPGAENIDLPKLLDRLDEWAQRVKFETMRHMYRFGWMSQEPQTEFAVGDSLARFCCYFLLQTLQEDCGVRYNPARKYNPDFCQVPDIFIHGIVDENGAGGTCATMPVVYVAVGRRLGYPLYLVGTKGHLFFRWHSEEVTRFEWNSPKYSFLVPPDSFNVEGSGEGIGFYSDAHYIQWPNLWEEQDFEHGQYLRRLNGREEFASFLVQRCCCLEDLRRYEEALKVIYHARRLCPRDARYKALHSQITKKFVDDKISALESMWFIQDHARKGQAGHFWENKGVAKIALGHPRPANLPHHIPVHYVRPEDADPLPPPPLNSWGQPMSAAELKIQEQNRQIMLESDRYSIKQQLLEQCKVDPIEQFLIEEE